MFYLVPHHMSELVFKDQFGNSIEDRCDRMLAIMKDNKVDMKQTFVMLDRDDNIIGTHSVYDDLMEWVILPPLSDTELAPMRFIRDYVSSGLYVIYYNDGVMDTLGYINKYYSTDNWCTNKLLSLITNDETFKDDVDVKGDMIILNVDSRYRVIKCYKNPDDKSSVMVTITNVPDQESIILLTEAMSLEKAQSIDLEYTVECFSISKTSTREQVVNAARRTMEKLVDEPNSELDTLTFKLFDLFS